jgi:hypothetical protein
MTHQCDHVCAIYKMESISKGPKERQRRPSTHIEATETLLKDDPGQRNGRNFKPLAAQGMVRP